MDIKLYVSGKYRTYTVPFVKARMLRRALELAERFEGRADDQITLEDLDAMVDFVVDLFDGQFSRDEFYDGVPADQLVQTVQRYMQMVVGVKGDADPNSLTGRP